MKITFEEGKCYFCRDRSLVYVQCKISSSRNTKGHFKIISFKNFAIKENYCALDGTVSAIFNNMPKDIVKECKIDPLEESIHREVWRVGQPYKTVDNHTAFLTKQTPFGFEGYIKMQKIEWDWEGAFFRGKRGYSLDLINSKIVE